MNKFGNKEMEEVDSRNIKFFENRRTAFDSGATNNTKDKLNIRRSNDDSNLFTITSQSLEPESASDGVSVD